MRLSIRQTLNHLVAKLNGNARKEHIASLQEQIEQCTLEVELNRLDDSYVHRLNHLSALQNKHLYETGKYHPVGNYAKMRREYE